MQSVFTYTSILARSCCKYTTEVIQELAAFFYAWVLNKLRNKMKVQNTTFKDEVGECGWHLWATGPFSGDPTFRDTYQVSGIAGQAEWNWCSCLRGKSLSSAEHSQFILPNFTSQVTHMLPMEKGCVEAWRTSSNMKENDQDKNVTKHDPWRNTKSRDYYREGLKKQT